MLKLLREMLMPTAPRPDGDIPTSQDRVRVATAVLLVEAAKADDDYSPEQKRHLVETLRTRFELAEEEALDLLALSEDKSRENTDLWHVTAPINEACSREEKERIMEEIWRVFFMDGYLDGHEDHMAHKVGKLLKLTHPQLIAAKLRAQDA